MSLYSELKRRNVFRVAAAYSVVAWLLVEVSSVVLPTFEAPGWILKVVTFLIILGFPLALLFAWAFEMTPEGLKREREVDRDQSITAHTGRKLDYAIIALLALAVGYLVVENYVLDDDAISPAATLEATAAADDRQSIAVLPFVNMSADADNEYFSDGIAEELLNLLAKLPQLKVSSRTSSFYYRGENLDIPTVASRLGVENILEGSVRRAGNRVRITAQLIDAQSDSHLWSESYDRELEDIFAIQDEIAHKIVEALKVTLAPGRNLESTRTASIEAYDYYLRGRAYFFRTTGEDTRRAIEMFSRAIEADPDYALAYAWLAISHTQLYRAWETDPEHLVKADAYSRKARELAPDLADGHIAFGFALVLEGQFTDAEQAFDVALRLDPESADAYYYYGMSAYHQGDMRRTLTLWQRAIELDPDDYRVWSLLPQVYRSLGRDEDESRAHQRVGVLARRLLERDPNDLQNLLTLAFSDLELGEVDKAIATTDQVLSLAKNDAVVFYNAACVYSRAGARDKAIAALENSHEAGLADPVWMEQDSDLDPVRDDPRFEALLARMKASLAGTD